MATRGEARRRFEVLQLSSTTPSGAGPYIEILENLRSRTPLQIQGQFGRQIRMSHVSNHGGIWIVETYLILDRIEILEISQRPNASDDASFVIPSQNRTFATRTCGAFDPIGKVGVIEYVKNGPKIFDYEELFSQTSEIVTQIRGSHFAINPIIEEDFIKQINKLDTIKRVRVAFERPNPGWDDIGLLSNELEGSGDAKRELTISAPRSGTIRKDRGLVAAIKRMIRSRTGDMSEVMIEGREESDAGNKKISSSRSSLKQVVSVPVTDDEQLYRRRFLQLSQPLIAANRPIDD